jgi:hypothetical protein
MEVTLVRIASSEDCSGEKCFCELEVVDRVRKSLASFTFRFDVRFSRLGEGVDADSEGSRSTGEFERERSGLLIMVSSSTSPYM